MAQQDSLQSFLFVGPIDGHYVSTLFQKLDAVMQKKGPLRACIILGVPDLNTVEVPEPPCDVYILQPPSVDDFTNLPPKVTVIRGVGDVQIGPYSLVYDSVDETHDPVTFEDTLKLVKNYYRKRSCDFFVSLFWPTAILSNVQFA